MTETKTIEIAVFRDPDGHPTCRSQEGACPMMGARKFGVVEVCMFTGGDIHRRPHGADKRDIVRNPEDHYLRPVDGCPVWS